MIPPIMYVMSINLINLSERANVSTFTVFKTKPDGRRVFVCVCVNRCIYQYSGLISIVANKSLKRANSGNSSKYARSSP